VFVALVILLAAALISGLLGVLVNRLLLQHRIIDRPNERSSHNRPTVRGGGIAIVTSVLAAAIWVGWLTDLQHLLAIGLCTVALAVVSFLDDLKSIPVAIRLTVHFLVAALALGALGITGITVGFNPGAGVQIPSAVAGALGCLWIAGYTNAFNFMDGINGIAAGQAAITGLGMALLAALGHGDYNVTPVLISLALAGAALGFLPYNFPTARMFMGDVGSAPLGFLLGVLVIWLAQSAGTWLLIPLALLHANFVLDTAITVVRRVARGEKWHQAHREHFYQRLLRSGKSHAFVTGWELALQGLTLALMVLYVQTSMPLRIALASAVVLIWLTFFGYCEFAFRRHAAKNGLAALEPLVRGTGPVRPA